MDRCYFCHNQWGRCSCGFPDAFDDAGREVEGVEGFEHGGVLVTRPNVSPCGRFFVDPVEYYGAAYLEWAARGK